MAKFLFAFDVVREINGSVISEEIQTSLRDELNDIIGGQCIAETTRYSDKLYFFYDKVDDEYIDISGYSPKDIMDSILYFLKNSCYFSDRDLKHIRMAISKVSIPSNIEIINPKKAA